MAQIPERLAETLMVFDMLDDRAARIETLIGIAERFEPVPAEIASRPYPEENRIKECESQAYVWAVPQKDGSLKYFFAVENPQGISAMATCVILDEGLSGAPTEQVVAVPTDIVYSIFGKELSMGKSMGLTGIVNRCKSLAKKQLQ